MSKEYRRYEVNASKEGNSSNDIVQCCDDLDSNFDTTITIFQNTLIRDYL